MNCIVFDNLIHKSRIMLLSPTKDFACVFFIMLNLLWAENSYADWPIWSGGNVSIPISRTQNGNSITRDVDGKKKQQIEFLQKVEVYRLDQTQLSSTSSKINFKLTFGKPPNKPFTGYDFQIHWQIPGGSWVPFYRYDALCYTGAESQRRVECQWWKLNPNDILIVDGWTKIAGNWKRLAPIGIPKKLRLHNKYNWRYDKVARQFVLAQIGDTITFTLTPAQKYKKVNGKNVPSEGAVTGIYGTYRGCDQKKVQTPTRKRFPSPIGDPHFHQGIDIAAPTGTSIGLIRDITGNEQSLVKVAMSGLGTKDELLVAYSDSGIFYVYAHIKISDLIISQNHRKHIKYHKDTKIGEIRKNIQHLHWQASSNTIKPFPYTDDLCDFGMLKFFRDRPLGNPFDIKAIDRNGTNSPPIRSRSRGPYNIFIRQDDNPQQIGKVKTDPIHKLQNVQGKVDMIIGFYDRRERIKTLLNGQIYLKDIDAYGVRAIKYSITPDGSKRNLWIPFLDASMLIVLPVFGPGGLTLRNPYIYREFFDVVDFKKLAPPFSYIITNRIRNAQHIPIFSKKGAWDTKEMKSGKAVYPDGKYQIKVEAISDLNLNRKGTITEDVIVDNSPPKLTTYKVLGRVSQGSLIPNIGKTKEKPAKIGDWLKFKLTFDQPLSVGPRMGIASLTPTKVLQDFPRLLLSWTKAPLPLSSGMIKDALLTGSFQMPEWNTQVGTKLYVAFGAARGLGAFVHPNIPAKYKPKPDQMTATLQDSNKKNMFLYADLVRPKVGLKKNGREILLICKDNQTGIGRCDGTTSKGRFLFQKGTPVCKATQGPKQVVASYTPPKSCKSQFTTFSIVANDCAGNLPNKLTKFGLPTPLTKSIMIAGIQCQDQENSNRCKLDKRVFQCSEKLNRCVVKERIFRKVGGCDHPDENVDLSTHRPSYANNPNILPTARIAILDSEFSPYTLRLFASFGEKVAIAPRTFSPDRLLAKHPVLVLPSGALLGQSNNRALKLALEQYVAKGGRLFVFAQAWGKEWEMVPGSPKGKGWNEVISCFWNGTYMNRFHVGLASLKAYNPYVSAPIDGHFTRLPPKATVLLTRTYNGRPTLVTYPHGKGLVVLASTYTDWAYYWSQNTADGRGMVRDLLTWLVAPSLIPFAANGTQIDETLKFRHTGKIAASQLRIRVLDPDRKVVLFHKQEARNIKPGDEVSFGIKYRLKGIRGIYRTEVTLLSRKGQIVYGPTELPGGRTALNDKGVVLLYTRGLGVELQLPPYAVSPRAASVTVRATITNQLGSKFSSPRRLRVYLNANSKPLSVTLAKGQSWYKEFAVPLSTKAPGNVMVQAVVFDKDAPLVRQPPWATSFQDTWPYAGGVMKWIKRSEPLIGLSVQSDAAYYHAGSTAKITIQLANIRRVSFPGQIEATLFSKDGKQQLWSGRWKKAFTGSTSETQAFTIPLPKDKYENFSLQIKIFDMSGTTPFLLRKTTTNLSVPLLDFLIAPVKPIALGVGRPLVLELSNRRPLSVASVQLTATLFDPQGKIVSTASKLLASVGANSITKQTFSLYPAKIQLGNYRLHYQAKAKGKTWEGNVILPAKLEIAFQSCGQQQRIWGLLMPFRTICKKYRLGDVFLDQLLLRNIGKFDLSPSVTWAFANGFRKGVPKPVGVVKAGEQGQLPVTFAIPKTIKRGFYPITAIASIAPGVVSKASDSIEVIAPKPRLGIFLAGDVAIGKSTDLQIYVDLTCCVVPPLSGKLTVLAPEMGYNHTSTITFTTLNPKTISLKMPIPSKVKPGSYRISATFALASGDKGQESRYFVIPGPHLQLSVVKASVKAGDKVEAILSNIGGVTATYDWSGVLRSPHSKVVTQASEAKKMLAPGEKKTLSLLLPIDAPTGRYQLRMTAFYGNEKAELDESIDVTGTSATLTLSTDKTSYITKSPMQGHYGITAGALGLSGAELFLRVFRFTYTDMKSLFPPFLQAGVPWPMYRGSPLRQGASFGVANFVTKKSAILWQTSLGKSSSPGDNSPSSPVIADVTGNGKLDVVGISATGNVVAIDGRSGKILWQTVAKAIGSPVVGDIDGKPGLEVIFSDAPCTLKALSAKKGALLWSAPLAGKCKLSTSPLLADIDNDKKLEIIIASTPGGWVPRSSSFQVLTVLQGATGKLKWGVSSQNFGQKGKFYAWDTPTTLAAGDLGLFCSGAACNSGTEKLDKKLEILGGNQYETQNINVIYRHLLAAIGSKNNVRWRDVNKSDDRKFYVDEYLASLPLVADLDRNGSNEVLSLRHWMSMECQNSCVSDKASGMLVALDGNTGRQKWSTKIGLPFRDGLLVYPASSGHKRIVVVSRKSFTSSPEVLVLDEQGKILWRKSLSSVVMKDASVHATDLTGDLHPDLLLQMQDKSGTKGGIYVLDLKSRKLVSIAQSTSSTVPVSADLDGDGTSEIVAGTRDGKYVVYKGASVSGSALSRRYLLAEQSHWSKKLPVNLGAGKAVKAFEKLIAPAQSGSYIMEGILKSKSGLEMARKRISFAVGRVGLLVKAHPLRDTYSFGQKVVLQGMLLNSGSSKLTAISLTVKDSSGKLLLAKTGLSIAAGGTYTFMVEWTPSKIGTHTFQMMAVSGREKVALTVPFKVNAHNLSLQVKAPSVVNRNPFNIRITLNNTGKTTAKVSLHLSGKKADEVRKVIVVPGGSAVAVFSLTIDENASFMLRASGDFQTTRTIKVAFGLKASLVVNALSPKVPGLVEIPYTLISAGKVTGKYPVTFTPPTNISGSSSYRVEHVLSASIQGQPAPQIRGVAYLYLTAGTHIIKYETYGYSGSISILVEEAKAKLRLSGPTSFRDDREVAILCKVENNSKVAGKFTVVFKLAKGTATLSQVRQEVQLSGGQSYQGTLRYPRLAVGSYQLHATLSSSNVSTTHSFKVEQVTSIALSATQGLMKGTRFHFDAKVKNNGLDLFSGNLQIKAGFASLQRSISVQPGKELVSAISLPLEQAPVGKATVLIRLLDKNGQAIAEKTLSFTRSTPVLVLTAPSNSLTFSAGSRAILHYVIENKDIFDRVVDLEVVVLGTAHQVKATIPAKGKSQLSITFPLARDLEELEYVAIHRWRSESGVKLLPSPVGIVRFHVTGVKVDAKGSLNKRLYKVGDTAQLSLSLRSVGTVKKLKVTVRVRYGAYEKIRSLEITPKISILSFQVSLGQLKYRNLTFQILSLRGRSLFIDSLLVHQATEPVWIRTEKDVYKPSETVRFTVGATGNVVLSLSALELYQSSAFKQTLALKKGETRQFSFKLPSNLVGGTHVIRYSVGKNSFRYFFNVHGPLVTAKALTLERSVVQPGETLQSALLLESRSNIEVEVVYSLLTSAGIIHPTATTRVAMLKKGTHLILSKIAVPSVQLGGMALLAEVYMKGNRRQSLSRAMARFDTGNFQLRTIRPTKSMFVLGAEDGELLADLYSAQRVTGTLIVKLEGATFYTKQHTISGLRSIAITIPRTSLSRTGNFLVEAEFSVGSEVSKASTSLRLSDAGPPAIEIKGVEDGKHYKDTVWPVVRVAGRDIANHTISILLNGFPFANGSPVQSEAEYRIQAAAEDIRGKKSQQQLSFVIDKTPPVIQIEGIEEGKTYQEVTPKVMIKDKYVDSSEVKLDGKPYQSGQKITSPGSHKLSVFAGDKAGNRAGKSISFQIAGGVSNQLILKITEPAPGDNFRTSIVTVRGKVAPMTAIVTIDGISATVDEQGDFTGFAHLQTCKTKIEVIARLGSEQVRQTLALTFTGANFVPNSLQKLHTFGSAVGGLAVYQEQIFVSLPNEGKVLKFTRIKGKLSKFSVVTEQLRKPTALAMSSKGTLFVVDASQDRLFRLDEKGKLGTIGKALVGLESVVEGTNGSFFAVVKQGQRIFKLEDGSWQEWALLPERGEVTAMSWNLLAKELWVTDASQQILWRVQDGKPAKEKQLDFPPAALTAGNKGGWWLAQKNLGIVHRLFKEGVKSYLAMPKKVTQLAGIRASLLHTTKTSLYISQPSFLKCSKKNSIDDPSRNGGTSSPDADVDVYQAPVGCGCNASSHQLKQDAFVWSLLMILLFLTRKSRVLRR